MNVQSKFKLCCRRGRLPFQGGACTLTWLNSSAAMACKSVSVPSRYGVRLLRWSAIAYALNKQADVACREGLDPGTGSVKDLSDGERTGNFLQATCPRNPASAMADDVCCAFMLAVCGAHARDLTLLQVTPILTLLDVPVRAVVAPFLDQHASRLLSEAVQRVVLPLEPAGGVWFQNSGMYHATVWHASHHQVLIHALKKNVEGSPQALRSRVCGFAWVHLSSDTGDHTA